MTPVAEFFYSSRTFCRDSRKIFGRVGNIAFDTFDSNEFDVSTGILDRLWEEKSTLGIEWDQVWNRVCYVP
jgi:hypothetical protein